MRWYSKRLGGAREASCYLRGKPGQGGRVSRAKNGLWYGVLFRSGVLAGWHRRRCDAKRAVECATAGTPLWLEVGWPSGSEEFVKALALATGAK